MENPVNVVKNNLSVSKMLSFVVVALAVFAVCDLAGLTNWILFPVTTARNKFGRSAALP